MQNVVRDVRLGLRGLARRPAFAAAAVLTLALGIGAATIIFSVVDAVLLRPLPFPRPERLVQVWETVPGRGDRRASPADYLDWRAESRTFASLASYDVRAGNLVGGGEPERVRYATVSANFFRALGVMPVRGRAFRDDDAAVVGARPVVLGRGLWLSRFGGDPGILGRTLVLDDERLTVVGVMPAGFAFPEDAALWVRAPFDVPELKSLPPDFDIRTMRDAWYFRVIGRLAPRASRADAQAEMDVIARRLREAHPVTNQGAGIRLVPLHEQLVAGARQMVLLLFGAVALVLLIACSNVANLVLARASGRTRELAVRTALGASRGRLVRQLLAESVALALVSGVAGVALAAAGVGALGRLIPPALLPAGTVTLDATVLAFSLVASLATAALFGAAPAFVASRISLRAWTTERGSGGGGRAGTRIRGALVVAEVALAVVLVAGAALTLQSLGRLAAVDPGFRPDGLVSAKVSLPGAGGSDRPAAARFYLDAVERVAAVPGVTGAAVALSGPVESGRGAGLRVEGRANAPGTLPSIAWQVVSPGYFEAARIRLLRGRTFDERDRGDAAPVAVINEATARRYFPGEDPLGRRINTGLDGLGVWVTIVGVVADTRNEGLAQAASPEMFRPLGQPVHFGGEEMLLLARSAATPATLAPALRRAVDAVRPGVAVYDVRAGAELVHGFTRTPRFLLLLLGAFAALALVLGAVGIYGVAAFAVSQRRREIGVRMALGAQRRAVFGMVLRGGLQSVAVGLGLGLAGAVAATGVLRRVLYGIGALEPWTLAVVTAVAAAVAVAATAGPAARAARVDPAGVLREE
ncbi:MAG TPA: ABC transporter permease [Longimicrobiales bacterium]|nr:ABC transporter permease [Longimicrobiales bacterium]